MASYSIAYLIEAVDKFSRPLREMANAVKNFEKHVDKSSGTLKRFGSMMLFVSGKALKYLAAATVTAGTYSLVMASKFEKLQLRLEGVAGSAQAAAKYMRLVRDQAMATGLSREELGETAIKLASRKLSIAETTKRMKQLSAISLVTGMDMSTVTQAYSNALQGFGVDPRLLKRIPFIVQALRELGGQFHVTGKAFDEYIHKHKMGIGTFNMVLDLLTKEGAAFDQVYKKEIGTVDVSVQRIYNTTNDVAASIGTIITKILGLDDKLKRLADRYENLAKKLATFAEMPADVLKKKAINYLKNSSINPLSFASPLAGGAGMFGGIIGHLWNTNNQSSNQVKGSVDLNINGIKKANIPLMDQTGFLRGQNMVHVDI